MLGFSEFDLKEHLSKASIFDEEEIAEVADSEEDTEDDEGDLPSSASSDDHDSFVGILTFYTIRLTPL